MGGREKAWGCLSPSPPAGRGVELRGRPPSPWMPCSPTCGKGVFSVWAVSDSWVVALGGGVVKACCAVKPPDARRRR